MNRRKLLMATAGSLALGLIAKVPAWGDRAAPKSRAFHFDFITDPHTVSGAGEYGVGGTFEELVIPHLVHDNVGLGDFLLTAGDLDVFRIARDSIEKKLVGPAKKTGKDYRWYPILGNHDATNTSTSVAEQKDGGNLQVFWTWMKSKYDNLNWSIPEKSHDEAYGPDGEGLKYVTYSWDHENCHFVSLNQYADDLTRAFVYDYQLAWLKADLEATDKEHIFVQGHQPVFANTEGVVDEDYKQTGVRTGHLVLGEDGYGSKGVYTQKSVRPKADFWALLKQHPVRAYFCGHAHLYTAEKFDGIWQVCGGACREPESSAGNTYSRIFVDGGRVTWKTYRLKNRSEFRSYEGVLVDEKASNAQNRKRKSASDAEQIKSAK